MLFEQPISLYGQRLGEDAADFYRVTDNANLFGMSIYLLGSNVCIEASDTNVVCDNSSSDVKIVIMNMVLINQVIVTIIGLLAVPLKLMRKC